MLILKAPSMISAGLFLFGQATAPADNDANRKLRIRWWTVTRRKLSESTGVISNDGSTNDSTKRGHQ
jgi:hypothetical protein